MLQFILQDWASHKRRFLAESTGMTLSILVALVMMVTTPSPPMLLCYVLWELASALLMLASYSRGSVGFTLLYGGFLVIDSVGLIRTLLA